MTVLAHHPIVEALPFVLPMLVVVLGVSWLTLRDRWKRRRAQ